MIKEPYIDFAGASIDDVFAITLFTTFLGLYGGKNINIAVKVLEIPLSAGVESGELILAIAVLSIIITAPLGAIGIKLSGEKWLTPHF